MNWLIVLLVLIKPEALTQMSKSVKQSFINTQVISQLIVLLVIIINAAALMQMSAHTWLPPSLLSIAKSQI